MSDPQHGAGGGLGAERLERAFAVERANVVLQQQWRDRISAGRRFLIGAGRRAEMQPRQPQRAEAVVADDEALACLIPDRLERDTQQRPRAVGEPLSGWQ